MGADLHELAERLGREGYELRGADSSVICFERDGVHGFLSVRPPNIHVALGSSLPTGRRTVADVRADLNAILNDQYRQMQT